MYLYTLVRGDESDGYCEVHFATDLPLDDWHEVVRRSMAKMPEDFELDDLVSQVEEDFPQLKSLSRGDRSYCNIDLLHISFPQA